MMKMTAQILYERIQEKKDSVLVTIIKDQGSSPRGAGASMVVAETGRIYGTIGGGTLELKAEEKAMECLKKKQGEFVEYRLSKEGLKMACGGDVDVVFTYVDCSELTKERLKEFKDAVESNKEGYILIEKSGEWFKFIPEGIHSSEMIPYKLKSGILTVHGKECYVNKLMNQSIVYIFGGGHLSRELVPVLTHLNFRCILTDDREEFASRENFPDAEKLYTRDYKELNGNYDIHENDYIIIITRGHEGDFEVEKFALNTPACYIGAVGSKNKIKIVNEKLMNAGYTKEQIARVTSPIGIDIQSETPAEIAISIAAQLIQKRAAMNSY